MKLLYNISEIPNLNQGTAVTIGNFDGVHLGHKHLIVQLRKKAVKLNLKTVVILFEPQPHEYFNHSTSPSRLTSLREKLEQLNHLQIDFVLCLKFDKTIASMDYQSFSETYFFNCLNAHYILLGQDFKFGKARAGDITQLQQLSVAKNCLIESFSDFLLDNERISSTRIRTLLNNNQFSEANRLLGRTYSICGRVVKGAALGRQWGVPTANLYRPFLTPPFVGVFCVQIKRENGKLYNGVANLGYRPTVDGSKCILEVHLLNVTIDLYGERLTIYFLQKLRDEIKFSSLDALIAQINLDIAAATHFLKLT